MNRATRLSLIAVMLLASTALTAIAYQKMQPLPPPEESKIVYRELPPPKLIGPCPPKLTDLHSEDENGPCLPNAEKILAFQQLQLRAARLFPDKPDAIWKYVYEQIDKEPARYIYWN